MEKWFEICHVQIPFEKILEYRIIDREYIFRPAYYVQKDLFRGNRYYFSHMVPYAAIYAESEYKSSIKAYKAISAGESVMQESAHAILSTLGDKLNIKALKYNKFVCRNQAGRVFSTYLQDVPACIERSDGKHSEVYPNDPLHKELGEPIAPSIEYIPALLILTKDELFTFYGNDIQIDAEAEYERLKRELADYQQEKKMPAKRVIEMPKLSVPQIHAPRINISLPQFGKKTAERLAEQDDIQNAADGQTVYDPMDLNHDGVVDEKDLELLKQRMENQ